MNIICSLCGESLEPLREFGDGYFEPKEYIYQCPVCGLKINYNEAWGWEKDYSEVEPNYQDKINEDEEEEY